MKMSNKIYDILKWVAMIVLPAIGTLYFALSTIWNFPYGEEIVGTLAAVEVFMGTVLQLSNVKYKKTAENA